MNAPTPNTPTEPVPAPEAAPAAEPKGKPGRKPAVPKPVDDRPLTVRVQEAFDDLRATDGVIRGEQRRIEACQAEVRDAHNRIVVARGAIRARERGLEREAVVFIQKQTGIRTIPGFSQPKPLSAWLIHKKETHAKLKAAEQAARVQLAPEPPAPTPASP